MFEKLSWPFVPDELRVVADRVEKGERPTVTVRLLLSWFWHSQRRGKWIVSVIRQALNHLHIGTVPDFDWTHLDGSITFVPATEVMLQGGVAKAQVGTVKVIVEDQPGGAESEPVSVAIEDSTYRIGRLSVANNPPVYVAPDTSLEQAVTLMLRNDYSQLPIMTGEREVKGVVSWRSIGSRLALGRSCSAVRDALEQHSEISANASIFEAVAVLRQHDCVLVRDGNKKISGILTAYDIGVAFSELGAPFLLLSQIENHIRRFINGVFTVTELESARNPGDSSREIRSVSDLTLGECVRLLQNPESWTRLSLPIDRVTFIKDLDEVRRIRNDVMHFDPEGIDEQDLHSLRQFLGFVERLQQIRA